MGAGKAGRWELGEKGRVDEVGRGCTGQRKENRSRRGRGWGGEWNNSKRKEVCEDQGLLEQEEVKATGKKGTPVLPSRSTWL